jgi:cell division protein FtsB
MRWLALIFVAAIVALQYPMWLGKNGWLAVRDLDRQLAAQRDHTRSSRRATRRSTRTCATSRPAARRSRSARAPSSA